MEDYNLAMFTHAMDFFKECANLKKSILACSYDVNIQSHILKYVHHYVVIVNSIVNSFYWELHPMFLFYLLLSLKQCWACTLP
jgi:hypothetical protein